MAGRVGFPYARQAILAPPQADRSDGRIHAVERLVPQVGLRVVTLPHPVEEPESTPTALCWRELEFYSSLVLF